MQAIKIVFLILVIVAAGGLMAMWHTETMGTEQE